MAYIANIRLDGNIRCAANIIKTSKMYSHPYAKVGPKFLAELLRRYPNQVQVGTLNEGLDWLDKDKDKEKLPTD